MPLPPELGHWRSQQRAVLLHRRMALDKAQRIACNRRITHWLLTAFPIAGPMVVAAYWPFKAEFDPRFALREWRARGALGALPVVQRSAAPLQFRVWWPGARTTAGVFGLPVPHDGAIVRPDVVLMPPVGFDRMGYRLGYGGGYYDRTLAALSPQPLKIGVGYALSRIDSIRPQPHDIPMDFVLTEDGVHVAMPSGLALVTDALAVRERAVELMQRRARASAP